MANIKRRDWFIVRLFKVLEFYYNIILLSLMILGFKQIHEREMEDYDPDHANVKILISFCAVWCYFHTVYNQWFYNCRLLCKKKISALLGLFVFDIFNVLLLCTRIPHMEKACKHINFC